MPSDQHRTSIRVLLHRLLQALRQILLMRRVLDNRYRQRVEEAQIAYSAAFGNPLDLLDARDLEGARGGPGGRILGLSLFDEERDEDSPLRVRVDAAAGVALAEGGVEERGAGGGFVGLV
jgi:hypothetical protein